MRKTFDYLYTVKAEDSIEIEDIGNCSIQVFNDLGYYWFLSIKTDLGDSYIKTLGPFHVDNIFKFSKGFNFNYTKFEYKESKLTNIIDNFINDPKKLISQVLIVEEDQIWNDISKINLKEMR